MDINNTNPVTSASPLKSSTNSNTTSTINGSGSGKMVSNATSSYPASYEYTNNGLLVPHGQSSSAGLDYYYDNQGCTNQQNCFMFSTMSYPATFMQQNATAVESSTQDNCVYYQLINNVQGYRWAMPAANKSNAAYYSNPSTAVAQRWIPSEDCGKDFVEGGEYYAMESHYCKGDSLAEKQCDGLRPKMSSKMHPVQLLHQIFRKEAFVMEYERINDGPFSQVRVTYKVNGKTYTAEATRLKEARRLCAKLVLRDQFPDLRVEVDNDIPEPEYDVKQFDNKHPVQILYQIFRYEPMEMHCEEEGAAHFAKHIFTFVIRGKKYQAKAETIKEAKRRAAIMALNEYFKKEN